MLNPLIYIYLVPKIQKSPHICAFAGTKELQTLKFEVPYLHLPGTKNTEKSPYMCFCWDQGTSNFEV